MKTFVKATLKSAVGLVGTAVIIALLALVMELAPVIGAGGSVTEATKVIIISNINNITKIILLPLLASPIIGLIGYGLKK